MIDQGVTEQSLTALEEFTITRMEELNRYYLKLEGQDKSNFLTMVDLAVAYPATYAPVIDQCPDEKMKRCLQTAVIIRKYANLFTSR